MSEIRTEGPSPVGEAARRMARRQALTAGLLFVGYSGYYACRSNFSVSMPRIAGELVAKGESADAAGAKVRLGRVVSFGTLAYAAGKFLGGGPSDALGGRRTFLLGMAGAILCTLAFALGDGLPVFTAAWVGNRFIQSIGWLGVVKLASRWFPYTANGRVMAFLSLSFLFGDAAARAFMGRLFAAGLGWRGVFFAVAALLGALLVANAWLLKEDPGRVGLPEPPADPGTVFAGREGEVSPGFAARVLPLLRDPGFLLVCLLSLGLTLLRETFNTWTPTYFVEGVGLSQASAADRSALFPLFGGVSVVLTGLLGDKFGRVGRAALICGGLTLAGGALVALGSGEFRGSPAWPVGLVAAAGFLLMGPYTFLAGAIALDLGGKRGSATASGWIDGVGYVGGFLAGQGFARLANRFGWQGAFTALAFVAWATALVALVFLFQQRAAARAA